jgi:hypothetical protein
MEDSVEEADSPDPDVASPPMTDVQGPPVASAEGQPCPECGAKADAMTSVPEDFVYAIGRLETRFPTVGIEREFQQCEARLPQSKASAPAGARLREVLEANPHLSGRMCYLLMVGGVPAYIVAPTGAYLRESLFEAVERARAADEWCVLIGRRGSIATPTTCAGVLAPIVACDQLSPFSLDELQESLLHRLAEALKARKIGRDAFTTVSRDLFSQVAASIENLGATDSDRALNYVLMQHPGFFLAAAERSDTHRLDRIEARRSEGLGSRRVVAVIVTFVDRTTGIPDRLFSRVDVTEEWPFLAADAVGEPAPLGFSPFVEHAPFGIPL